MTLMTTGSVTFSVAWAVDEHGQALVPPSATNVTSMFKYVGNDMGRNSDMLSFMLIISHTIIYVICFSEK